MSIRRVLIIGCGGAGKSTLAVRMGPRLGLPVIHLDEHNWKPGWVATPSQEWKVRVEELLAGESWIMDGNYGGTVERRMEASDAIVLLDRSRWVCLWRIVKRRLSRGAPRPGLADGCPEKLDWPLIAWVWSFPRRHRPRILELISRQRVSKRVWVLSTESEVEDFLEGLPVK